MPVTGVGVKVHRKAAAVTSHNAGLPRSDITKTRNPPFAMALLLLESTMMAQFGVLMSVNERNRCRGSAHRSSRNSKRRRNLRRCYTRQPSPQPSRSQERRSASGRKLARAGSQPLPRSCSSQACVVQDPLCGPSDGGLLTVTTTLLEPLVKPFAAEAARRARCHGSVG